MEKDLDKIRSLAISNKKQNYKFRCFLKMLKMKDKELDSIVKDITIEVSQEINCDNCKNCCRGPSPTIEKNEITEISKFLNITETGFIDQYINMKESDDDEYSIKNPCPFFQNNICIIEKVKPVMCINYPYLLKEEFRTRLLGIIENYGICPIVFNVYEKLKERVGFRK